MLHSRAFFWHSNMRSGCQGAWDGLQERETGQKKLDELKMASPAHVQLGLPGRLPGGFVMQSAKHCICTEVCTAQVSSAEHDDCSTSWCMGGLQERGRRQKEWDAVMSSR